MTVALDVCLLVAASDAGAAGQNYPVRPATAPIVVDGRLDEPAWEQAVAITLPYEYFPGNNSQAQVVTVCRVTYDATRLLVGCRADDPDARAIRATLADRDAPREDDSVGFLVDPFNDGRRAFQFRVNARGVQMDAMRSDVEGTDDWSWDAIWDARAQVTSEGFTAEFGVPFSSLRFPRTRLPQVWGFMATREMPRSTSLRMRSALVDSGRDCLVCQFDTISGLANITPGRNLEFDPTVSFARTDVRATPAAPLTGGDPEARVGLSARWSLTPNVVLSGTVNPDFYQVEADAAQFDVNTQFQLRFPEKRPFFLEGGDLFRTPIEALFTRTIADPVGGIKLSGKQGAHAFGAFVTRDDVTGVLIPGFDGSSFVALARENTTTVLRYRRDVGPNGSTLGLLVTDREAGDYGNRVAGIDGLVRPSAADSIRFQWLGSQTDYPDSVSRSRPDLPGTLTGQGFLANYTHQTRRWIWNARAASISSDFRADAGFVPQVGTHSYAAGLGRIFVGGTDRRFDEVSLYSGCDRTTDWSGMSASWGCDNEVSYTGPMQTTLTYNAAPNFDYYRGVTYNDFRHNIDATIRPNGAFNLFLDSSFGHAIDFTNVRHARRVRYTAGSSYSMFGRLTGDVSIAEERMSTESRDRIYVARITQGQANYHFTPRAFARVILQYSDVVRNTGAYLQPIPPQARRLFTQLLFSYTVNPQTVFLSGYSDSFDGGAATDLLRLNRTFFLKVGYAFLP
jgi:hypothetical protein